MTDTTHTAAKDGGSDDQDEASREQKALLGTLQKFVSETRDLTANKNHREEITSNRLAVRGLKGDGKKRVRANLIFSTLASNLPHIYAKNPEVSVNPTEAVSDKGYSPAIRMFSKTLQIVLNRSMRDGKFKKRGKGCVRSAQTTAIGWIKAIYQRELGEDPIIKSRIQDTQDNLQRIQFLLDKSDDNTEREESEAQKAELELQLTTLEKQVEVSVAEGMVYDRILSEDMVIDGDVRDFDSYTDSRRIGHRVWYTPDEYEQAFKKEHCGEASKFQVSSNDDGEKRESAAGKTMLAVWEIWDRWANTIYTFAQGAHDWARDPYSPEITGEQWFPFFPLGFNLVDGQFLPMSDVELLKTLQNEYDDVRNDYAEVRSKNKPHYLADAADVNEKTALKVIQSEIGEVTLVDTNGRPIGEVIKRAETMRVDPANYDTSAIRSDIEFVSGQGDASRGSVAKAKTATEADILASAMSSRTGERQDVIEDWVAEIMQYTAEILLQELSETQVKRIAGQDAVWPSMSKEEVFDMVQIDMRAGSSGRPDKGREQKTWMEFLPQIREMVVQVGELRATGNVQAADSIVAIMKESLRRFDERIDIEEFLPQQEQQGEGEGEGQEQGGEQDAAAQQMQLAEFQKNLELMTAQIKKLESEALKNTVESMEKAPVGDLPVTTTQQTT